MFKNISLRTKIIFGFLLAVIPAVIVGFFTLQQLRSLSVPLDKDIPDAIIELDTSTRLYAIALSVRYYDEVLTQSARNYAFTQNIKWKTRYETTAPQLDAIIKEAISLGDDKDKLLFKSIDGANIALVKMERESLSLTSARQISKAISILESDQYSSQKTIYKQGLDDYLGRHNSTYEQSNLASLTTLQTVDYQMQNAIAASTSFTTIVVFLSFWVFFILGIAFAFFLTRPIIDLKETALSIAEGSEELRSPIRAKDEIGELARAVNAIADKLQRVRTETENQIKERVTELEKLNKFMVGREIKMIELKKELEELKIKK